MIFNSDQCREIISWHQHYNMMNVSENPNVDFPERIQKKELDYNIAFVTRDDRTQWFFDSIHTFLLDEYPNNLAHEGPFFYLHKWDKGNKFEKHIDKRRECSWRLVCGATLNSDFEGGKLIAYNPEFEFASKVGEVYLMGAERLHEVTEITSGTRFSFVYFLSAMRLGEEKTII